MKTAINQGRKVIKERNNLSYNKTQIEGFCWRPDKEPNAVILSLANAYGVLKYADTLGDLLAQNNFLTISVNGQGQGKSSGKLTVQHATDDILFAYNESLKTADEFGCPLILLIHCTGMYPFLKAIEVNPSIGNHTSLLILYSYLHEPKRLYDQTIKKMNAFGIRYDEAELFDWEEKWQSKFSSIRCPLHIVHPTIKSSIARATIDEVHTLSEFVPHANYYFPEYGYEILDYDQKDNVSKIFSKYYLPILSNHLES